MRQVNEIIVHCSATRPDWMSGATTSAKVSEIRRWHIRDRGWRDIGYHYLIDRDGTVAEGRPVDQTGAHVAGHNTGTIGVCLLGGHGSNENDQFGDHFTAAQDRALRGLLKDLQRRLGVKRITGHNQYSAKACPGFHVPQWLASEPNRMFAAPQQRDKDGGNVTKRGAQGPDFVDVNPPLRDKTGFFAALLGIFKAIFGGK